MPFKVEGLQEAYKLQLFGGVPVAPVTRLGTMHYVLCCPLCGLLHEVGQSVTHGAIFEPRCIVKRTHPPVYAKWVKKHPEAAEHGQIVLKLREFDEVVISTTTTPERIAA